MPEIASHWQLDVAVESEWLVCVLNRTAIEADPLPPFASRVWEHVEQHSINRLIIELGDRVLLSSHLVGQIVMLHKRSCQQGGATRICRFSDANYDVLHIMRLAERFPNYPNHEDAMSGQRP